MVDGVDVDCVRIGRIIDNIDSVGNEHVVVVSPQLERFGGKRLSSERTGAVVVSVGTQERWIDRRVQGRGEGGRERTYLRINNDDTPPRSSSNRRPIKHTQRREPTPPILFFPFTSSHQQP